MTRARPTTARLARRPAAGRIVTLKLASCISGIQSRASLDQMVIEEYATAMMTGAWFPPIVVFHDGKTFWTADGFHRVAAAAIARRPKITADVRRGTQRDALLYAVGANAAHGLRRTNADKRHAVELLLADKEWRRWSDREIARRCGVGHDFVADVRASLATNASDNGRTYRTKHGTLATMHVIDRKNGHARPALPAADPRLAVHFSSDTAEHYTPQAILTAVVDCLGAIDLDPCSNSRTEGNVPAARHFTRADNGLQRPWKGRVYMNPPYGREIEPWVEKLTQEHRSGRVPEAIALVPARTDTQWFRCLRDYICCFIGGRLTFVGNQDPAPFPSALFYLGDDVGKFYRHFSGFGDVWQRIEPAMFAE